MARLTTRFPDFAEIFDGRKMRSLVQQLEQLFARVRVDERLGAYTKTADFTVGIDDGVILVDTTAISIKVTLPEISTVMVKEKYTVELVKTVAANTMTVVPMSSDTIMGSTSVAVTTQWSALEFRATTGNWVLV